KYPIQPDERGDAIVLCAMDQDLLALVRVHRRDERAQILFGRRVELHRNVDVVHAKSAYATGFLCERVSSVIMKSEVDHDLDTLSCGIRELPLVWLTCGQQ